MLGGHGDVGLHLRRPPSGRRPGAPAASRPRSASASEGYLRPRTWRSGPASPVGGCPSSGPPSASRRRVRPLLTAPSMVAGQPVSVQAPAMTALASSGCRPGAAQPRRGDEGGLGVARWRRPQQLAPPARGGADAQLARRRARPGAPRAAGRFLGAAQAAADVARSLGEDPLHRASRVSAAKSRPRDPRSYQRCTSTIGWVRTPRGRDPSASAPAMRTKPLRRDGEDGGVDADSASPVQQAAEPPVLDMEPGHRGAQAHLVAALGRRLGEAGKGHRGIADTRGVAIAEKSGPDHDEAGGGARPGRGAR